MSDLEKILYAIKTKGTCIEIRCGDCPFSKITGACSSRKNLLHAAKALLSSYTKEEIFDILL